MLFTANCALIKSDIHRILLDFTALKLCCIFAKSREKNLTKRYFISFNEFKIKISKNSFVKINYKIRIMTGFRNVCLWWRLQSNHSSLSPLRYHCQSGYYL